MVEMVYKISFDYTNFLNLDLDIEALADRVCETMGEDEFFSHSLNNLPLSEHWVDIGAKFIDVGLQNSRAPDITLWNSSSLMLSPAAFSILEHHLNSLGEFLPITINNSTYHIFNCLNLVDVDESNSEIEYLSGVWQGVKTIAFNADTEKKNLLFKTQFDRCSALYCGQKLLDIINSNNLEGLNFNQDLLAQF